VPSPVTKERVRFDNGSGDLLVADLYRPAEARQPLPGAVVSGSWTTVKEQMAGLYAQRLAENGFAALAFDPTGFGQSRGPLREVENPTRKTADIRAAFTHLTETDGVDPDRLAALAICASSGYTCDNAAADARVKTVGLVAPWLHDPDLVQPYYGGAEGVELLLARGKSARQRYETTGTVEYVPACSATDKTAAMFGPYDYYLDPTRGSIPEWGARFATMAWPDWLGYDAIATAQHVNQPVVMVHSRNGAVPDGAEAFAAHCAHRADIVWTSGTQLDFYDQPQQVQFAVDRIVDHFRATL
jgi:fermentation-respiration switch protein FrsA (DUF1100 family)